MDTELEKAFSDFQSNLNNLYRLLPSENNVPEGITPAEYKVLMQIGNQLKNHDEVRPSMIASCSHITKSALSQSLKSLEAKGMIVRSKSAEDSRAVTLRLTSEGQSITDNAEKFHLDYIRKLIEYLGIDEIKSLDRTVHKILEFHLNEGMELEQLDHYDFKKTCLKTRE